MRRILITGGAGFIGTHLAESLCLRGAVEVVLFDSFRRDSLAHVPQLRDQKQVTVVSGDVQDAGQVRAAMEGADTVVHLAAIAGVSSYYAEPLRTLQTNILGTVNALEQAAASGVKRFIHFSTSEIYGSNAMWVDETMPSGIGSADDKRWVYATSKLAGENFALRYGEKHGFDAAVVRPFNIYGPRQVGEGAISNFCRAVAENKPLQVYGDGTAIRAWCYIDDMVNAMNVLLDHELTDERIFNIGNPKEVETTMGLARRFTRLFPDSRIEYREGVHAEVRARIPSIERARRVLGYEPIVDLDEGLRKTVAWFKESIKTEAKAKA